jgi:hypothetical protein
MQNREAAVENHRVVLPKLKYRYDPAITCTGTYSEESEEKDLFTSMFIALFIISEKCKQTKRPSVNEWINKMYACIV